MTQPFVFISYAWESDVFRTQVKALRDYLLANGVAVVADFDHAITPPDVGWTAWMQHSIEDAALVLVVCSPSYKPRFEKRAPVTSGKGVAWEGAVITQELYNAAQRNSKFYPVFPDPFNFADCPLALQDWSNGHTFPSKQVNILTLVLTRLGAPLALTAPLARPLTVHQLPNPFNPWQPTPPAHFWGRAGTLRRLQHALDERRSVSIVGDWLTGKTSLLHAWKHNIEKTGRVVRLLSNTGHEAVSCGAFVQEITGVTITNDDADHIANILRDWTEKHGAFPPLVLIDEADAILQQFPFRFFERLRGLVTQQKICLVIATFRPISFIPHEADRTSPLVNILETIHIGLLEESIAERIIELGSEVFSLEQQSLMRRWSGRHPYFLKLFGKYLWDAHQNDTPINIILDIANEEAAPRLHGLWKTLSEKEKSALIAILDGHKIYAPSLRTRGLVAAGTDGDKIFGEVFSEWLRGQMQ